ncbi:MAG: protein-disulfide reductase DsbD family protein [Hyphomicrobiaceae bacterium]|nr:protein-disulfide reductase DsbD family protein [Hyphomicrobiaceae bacterium]
MPQFVRLFFGLAAVWLGFAAGAGAQSVASPWVDQERAQTRLLAAEADGRMVGFVEIKMPEGWKTYWRNPGDAGGLPPSFDFSKSENIADARVLYPAPKRLSDRAGETIGYEERVIFPVAFAITAKDKPVQLRVAMHFGVCREICVPLEATHELTVPPGIVGPADGALAEALAHIPRSMSEAKPGDPTVVRAQVESYEEPAQISFSATFPGGAKDADLFVEAPEGLYVPMPKRRAGGDGETVTFDAAISSPAELKQLLGKPLKITLVGSAGQSEAVVTVE